MQKASDGKIYRSGASDGYDLLDDKLLWNLYGSDPYCVTIGNLDKPGIMAGRHDGSRLSIYEGDTPTILFITGSSVDGDYEFGLANGTNDVYKTNAHRDWQKELDFITFTNQHRNYARVHFIPRSIDYAFNIINLSGEGLDVHG